MYALFERGEFGNKTRSWSDVKEYLASGFQGLVALRYMEKPGGPCTYNLNRKEVQEEVYRWLALGYKPGFIQVSEMLPCQRIRLAGEIMQSENYLDLTYYDTPGYHMRDGLKKFGQHATGLKALGLVHKHMDPASSDNLQRLFCEYPNHVIEFTCCEGSVGELGWNTVFWECRGY